MSIEIEGTRSKMCGYISVDRYLRISAIFCGYEEDTDMVLYDNMDTDTDRNMQT